MNNPKFYESPEYIQPTKLTIALTIGVITSILLAYLYNLLSASIPIIYFNVLITFGFGMAIGLAVRLIGRISKLTSKKSRLILAITMAISAFIFQWTANLGTLNIGFPPSFGEYISDIPSTFFEGENWSNLADLYAYGAWSIGGIIFNKLLLLAVWLIELGIIVILPIMSVVKAVKYPFSESMNQWYPKFTLTDHFESMSSKRYFLEEYHSDLLKGIQSLKMGDGWSHGIIHIYYLDKENHAYLSFEKVFIEGRGKGKKRSSFLIENLQLKRQDAKSILNEFHNEKDRFDVF